MSFFHASLTLATLLCGLVAGFVLAFAIVVMPGIQRLGDREFLQAFKEMDGIIQNNHPVFMLVWLGSALALIVSATLGFGQLAGTERLILIAATAIYVLGVQLPTISINIPLNNHLQKQELESLSESELQQERTRFEPRWIRWNTIRTYLATLTTLLLITVCLRVSSQSRTATPDNPSNNPESALPTNTAPPTASPQK